MESEEKKRQPHRTVDERVIEIDAKIAAHKSNIITLERRKKLLLTPKKSREKKPSMSVVIAEMKKAGLTPDEIVKKLGLKIT